jgi:NAD-dependent DNA ligase
MAIPGWTPKCAGKTLLFAGKSWRLPRLTELATAEGGRVVDAVSPTLDYIVVGQARGTPPQVKEAEKLNLKQGAAIEILDEAGFLALKQMASEFPPTSSRRRN